MLEVINLKTGYGKKEVLRDINISFEEGLIYGILGQNGSGKTTLLRSISGRLKPFEGQIKINGVSLEKLSSKKIAGDIAMVIPQEKILFDFKVVDLVKMGRTPYMKWYQFESEKDSEIVDRILEETNLSSKKYDYYNELSSGQRQLVELSRALVQEPSWLLLDEPIAHLDLAHQKRIMSLIMRLNKEKGLSVICVLHDINIAALFCDKIIMLKDQNVYTEGDARNILNQENINNVFDVGMDVVERQKKKQFFLVLD